MMSSLHLSIGTVTYRFSPTEFDCEPFPTSPLTSQHRFSEVIWKRPGLEPFIADILCIYVLLTAQRPFCNPRVSPSWQ